MTDRSSPGSAIRPLREDEVTALHDLADNGGLICDCDSSPELCHCSTVMMLCDEWRAMRASVNPDVAQAAGEPVSYRWRQPGNKHWWIYDPTPEWIEDHRHEIELEALYVGDVPQAAGCDRAAVAEAHEHVRDGIRTLSWRGHDLDGLKVLEKIAIPGNYLPDQYVLERKGIYYSFTPHVGISRCLTIEQARQW
jgi:hypothetical protein